MQLINTAEFISKLTGGKMPPKTTQTAAANMRANGLSFYDNWSRSHVSILPYLDSPAAKRTVIEGIKKALDKL